MYRDDAATTLPAAEPPSNPRNSEEDAGGDAIAPAGGTKRLKNKHVKKAKSATGTDETEGDGSTLHTTH